MILRVWTPMDLLIPCGSLLSVRQSYESSYENSWQFYNFQHPQGAAVIPVLSVQNGTAGQVQVNTGMNIDVMISLMNKYVKRNAHIICMM